MRYSLVVTDPRKDLEAATRRYRRTASDHEQAREATIAAVVEALRSGIPPVEVERLSPFTGAHIRKMAREHGIPPASPGPKRS